MTFPCTICAALTRQVNIVQHTFHRYGMCLPCKQQKSDYSPHFLASAFIDILLYVRLPRLQFLKTIFRVRQFTVNTVHRHTIDRKLSEQTEWFPLNINSLHVLHGVEHWPIFEMFPVRCNTLYVNTRQGSHGLAQRLL